jgi:HEPN domain-containing protein
MRTLERLDPVIKPVWVNQYNHDIDFARKAYGEGYYAWACFVAQQAAEKAAKALLIHLEMIELDDLKTHNILKLVRHVPKALLLDQNVDIKTLEINAAELSNKENTSRYPSFQPDDPQSPLTRPEYSPRETQQAIEQSEFIINNLERLM